MKPKHPAVRKFLDKQLFDNLHNFKELEDRISQLPEHERGDAFEVFAEAYFVTQKISQTEEVWPHSQIPVTLRKNLGLSERDMGVDGVLQTKDGRHHAYQVKFRSRRASLGWEELSTFLGLSDRVHGRILFTNSCDLPALLRDRTDFFAIKGNDLDALREDDFRCIAEWVKSGSIVCQRRTARPHQNEALENIIEALKSEKRTTAVMACATGKTLVSLWLSERMNVNSVLVLAPSLQLIRQILHEWMQEITWENFSFLCVCSDRSVVDGIDEVKQSQSDLDFRVTTSSEEVSSFLREEKTQRKIIFSTYHSAHVVGSGMPANFSFDIGIFDEAHKTAGREGSKFSFALHDENVAIDKRVFLTATPRHYDIGKKDKEGDLRLVFSMDDSEIYGSISHKLSFASAVSIGIICPYKIVISITTDEDITRDLLSRGEVVVNGDATAADQVAQFVALRTAIEKCGAKKVFTFHGTVKAASSFCDNSKGFLELDAYHVHGEMPTSRRESILRDFEEADKAIVSNARCLTEGVDVPAVDMVVFMSPKKSRVDIVQASGRAMRKVLDKKFGYVLLPVHLEIAKGETIESALKSTKFDHVWETLEAMCEQDEILAEVIRQMREDKGRKGFFDDRLLRERLEFIGPEIGLDRMRQAITTATVERLGSSWSERYGLLLKYVEINGNAHVPSNYSLDGVTLGSWVSVQRKQYRSKILLPERQIKLEAVPGWDWSPFDTQWDDGIIALSSFHERERHLHVPCDHVEGGFGLGSWIRNKKKAHQEGKLSVERQRELESFHGWDWLSEADQAWESAFRLLQEFVRMYGHARVPRGYKLEGFNLSTWVLGQRGSYRKKSNGTEVCLTLDRIARLEALPGWSWNTIQSRNEKAFSALDAFCKREGHALISSNHVENGFKLGQWVTLKRQAYQNPKSRHALTEEDQKKLESYPGWFWDGDLGRWERGKFYLLRFCARVGHSRVKSAHVEDGFELGRWIGIWRYQYKKKILPQWKIEFFESLPSWSWDIKTDRWYEGFDALKKYVAREGHASVPVNHVEENFQLGTWACTQRYSYAKQGYGKKLSQEKIALLESMPGWSWNRLDDGWISGLGCLKNYVGIYGDSKVPARFVMDGFALGTWVCGQRYAFKKGALSSKKIELLERIPWWTWNEKKDRWDATYGALLSFVRREGHACVPCDHVEDGFNLGEWLQTQRKAYRKGRFDNERKFKLEKLNGWTWNTRE